MNLVTQASQKLAESLHAELGKVGEGLAKVRSQLLDNQVDYESTCAYLKTFSDEEVELKVELDSLKRQLEIERDCSNLRAKFIQAKELEKKLDAEMARSSKAKANLKVK